MDPAPVLDPARAPAEVAAPSPTPARRALVFGLLAVVACVGLFAGGRAGGMTGHAAGGLDDPGGCGGAPGDDVALAAAEPLTQAQLVTSTDPLAALQANALDPGVAVVVASGRTYYVDDAGGNDSNIGTTTTSAWRTVDRVNRATLSPGDTVRFKRGGVWRESLVAQSGSLGKPITYKDYGSGEKPQLLGSIDKSGSGSWTSIGPNVWATGGATATTTGSNLLPNPSFGSGAASWAVYANSGAGAAATGALETTRFDTAPAAYAVTCSAGSSTNSDIQLYSGNFSITKNTYYKLTFRARSTSSALLTAGLKHVVARLTQGASPWGDYTSELSAPDLTIGPTWTSYTVYFRAKATASDARLTFFLGTALSAGKTFLVDTLSLQALTSATLPDHDVGNVIMNGTETAAKKFSMITSTSARNDFYYDASTWTLYLASTLNPGVRLVSVEVGLNRDIISQNNAHHVVYLNLDLRYGSAMGIGGENVSSIVVRGCDFRFIGGGEQADTPGVRYGNGIQFWGNAKNIVVVDCTFGEIYDAAVTNQYVGPVDVTESNILYVNNVMWNAEYCFEYWARRPGTTGSTDHIYFLNNTCLASGNGFGHAQRPDPSGRDLTFWNSDADVSDFYVANNIFAGAVESSVFVHTDVQWLSALRSDHNDFFPASTGAVSSWAGARKTLADFVAASGGDTHSLEADPLHVSAGASDTLLSQVASGQTTASPAVDAGSAQSADVCWVDDRGRRCLSSLSTRTDGVADSGTVDLGAHTP